jgi:aconitate hydratase
VGIGLLPLQFKPGENAVTLGLTGRETYDIYGISDDLMPRQSVKIMARNDAGHAIVFEMIARLDTPIEVEYYRNGGILRTVLRNAIRDMAIRP